MSKKEFEDLLNQILKVNANLTQESISLALGYNEGYISQMLSRGKISDKFVNALKLKFLQNAKDDVSKADSWEPPFDNIIEERVMIKTLINHVLKIEAVLYERKLEDVRRDFHLDTTLLLDELTGGAASKP